ncbi:hypothetical protein B0T16DRAFT_461718 [Cercophora newfieldiana]|uniref:Uncharacterized protein n=1 Tax=Cercophora newfieldiana TaxID=92897 RepID=A0AA39XY44_9PEZI|nr:hypothetical protein B0T16DRAFT_461718 [Cercophora newfieldiana]
MGNTRSKPQRPPPYNRAVSAQQNMTIEVTQVPIIRTERINRSTGRIVSTVAQRGANEESLRNSNLGRGARTVSSSSSEARASSRIIRQVQVPVRPQVEELASSGGVWSYLVGTLAACGGRRKKQNGNQASSGGGQTSSRNGAWPESSRARAVPVCRQQRRNNNYYNYDSYSSNRAIRAIEAPPGGQYIYRPGHGDLAVQSGSSWTDTITLNSTAPASFQSSTGTIILCPRRHRSQSLDYESDDSDEYMDISGDFMVFKRRPVFTEVPTTGASRSPARRVAGCGNTGNLQLIRAPEPTYDLYTRNDRSVGTRVFSGESLLFGTGGY